MTSSAIPLAEAVPVLDTFGTYSRTSWTGVASASAALDRRVALRATPTTARFAHFRPKDKIISNNWEFDVSSGFGQMRRAQQRTELHHGGGVDLADARLGDLDHAADLLERQLLVVVQVQHQPVAWRQRIDGRAEPLDELVFFDDLVRTSFVGIVQEIAQRLHLALVVAAGASPVKRDDDVRRLEQHTPQL